MTFGEHLEELRSCLFKALTWLVGGFLIGLLLAKPAVVFIEGPLVQALSKHYKEMSESQLKELQRQGIPLPANVDTLSELVGSENLLPELVYVHPADVLDQFYGVYEGAGGRYDELVELAREARGLLDRLETAAGSSAGNLTQEERSRLSEAVALIEADQPHGAGQQGFTVDDRDRLVKAIHGGKALSSDDLARLRPRLERLQRQLEADLARIAKGTELLGEVRLPQVLPGEQVQRRDLAQVFLWRPIERDRRIQPRALGVHESFMIYIKAALLVGVLVASPGIFYHIWSFVASGLYYHERRFVHVFGPFSLALFLAGAGLVFFFVFPVVLRFLFTFNAWLGIAMEPRITEWLGFVLILPLGFGIAFQLPLVMLFLERIGVFDIQAYLSKWRIAILVIAVLSMILTPADPGSMMMMAVPLIALYFGGIFLCRFMPRSRSPYDDEEEEAAKRTEAEGEE